MNDFFSSNKASAKIYHDFRERLLAWYRRYHRRLPWRETQDPYRIWVSEVMLQQTQVKKVLEYYNRFIRRFPDVGTLGTADVQEVLKVWEKMGYYARARNLHQAARIISAEMEGRIPDDYPAFKLLPGVGDYIAAAVLSIAFNQPFAVLDGNVKRVLARQRGIEAPVNESGSRREFQESADRLLDRSRPGLFNQAMMELGATLCRPQNPLCSPCPVHRFCAAFSENRQAELPRRITKKSVPTRHIAVGIVHRNGKMLITRRKEDGLLGGLWEFPGGKVKEGEKAEQACRREIQEETNLIVEVQEKLTRIHHAYSHFRIVMDVYHCRYVSGEVRMNGPTDFRWITAGEIDRFPFPVANHKFIPLLNTDIPVSEKKE